MEKSDENLASKEASNPTKAPRETKIRFESQPNSRFRKKSLFSEKNHEYYDKFKSELTSGALDASESDLEKIVLVPNFVPRYFSKPKENIITNTHRRNDALIKTIPKDKYKEIRENTLSKSKKIYEAKMKSYNDMFKQDVKSISELNVSGSQDEIAITFPDMSHEEMEQKYMKLEHNLKDIIHQNEALHSHLLIIGKARDQLQLQRDSLKEVIKWQNRAINNVKNATTKK
ncbi:hypothetical protein TVAG_080460 [Trichomonas vaginalis G3]|uniref:Uncharacterized protein n=1 Tax=Trichomonas vaginalis (strain ATCC PRA-98 / G3) TaxID=412133 RepID=A2FLT7_TRIV3|nr:hypothetical protein TVAGG3_0260190 [Trichomonas vaginalis G3]EAX94140.1 hypothetical protein TVAG_080460 [Trichomonas vaginalis G3]KAI5525061.1 hypothetical protein TVAGG3_0260190 [Trichomonas vaginalis G3]|eukprot:XP_001307070.1 hypothetical protein [Trichomonas vaginalis G3]